MAIHIGSAYQKGMMDALSGAPYSNPFVAPEDADETFDHKHDHAESYHVGYEANFADFNPARVDYHAIIDDVGRD